MDLAQDEKVGYALSHDESRKVYASELCFEALRASIRVLPRPLDEFMIERASALRRVFRVNAHAMSLRATVALRKNFTVHW